MSVLKLIAPGVAEVVPISEVDGRKITWEADDKVRTWESFSPVVRDLLAGGFMKYCLPTKRQRDDFFASVKVRLPGA